MNRRDFITVAGGVSATSFIVNPSTFAATTTVTPLFVRGLIMVSFEDPTVLRLGFPKAPGHKATLAIQPQTGSRRVLSINGNGTVESQSAGSGAPRIAVPELVRMKEFYGDAVRSRISECPSVIEIPYAAIQSITTNEISDARYEFIRTDTGKEVASFRPRQIAESIQIALSASGALKLEHGKTVIPLENAKELRVEHTPDSTPVSNSPDSFADHFHHYLTYIDRPASARFDVIPKKVGGSPVPAAAAGARNFFPPYFYCYMVAVP